MTILPPAPRPNDSAALQELFAAVRDETVTADQFRQLEERLSQDAQARAYFTRLVQLTVLLEHKFASAPPECFCPSVVVGETAAPVAIVRSPILGFLPTALRSTAGFFSSGWPVAYLVATVIFGIGLLIGSLMPASGSQQIAKQSSSPGRSTAEPKMEPVGRITGMVGCKWADPSTEAFPDSDVSLGRQFSLVSGLMEITYDTGAKVILQGPVTYEVESAAGGYLSVGKLTARVEKRGERTEERGENDANHQIPNPKSQIVDPSHLSSLRSLLFSVRTPTAAVTDLGTEFGVEVSRDGQTTSHVFRGSVRLQVASANRTAEAITRVLHENESARVEKNGGGQDGGNRIVMLGPSAQPANFVRQIPKQAVKILDLVDVVAGGDGFSGLRNRGIDPTSGRIADAQPLPDGVLRGDHKYHRVEAIPFVDGVFLPDGGRGPVQIDSGGRTFDGFDKTDNKTAGHIWAGKPVFVPPEPFPTKFGGVEYASPGHGVLAMHANKGITFNLEAIRRANPNCKLARFRALAANTEWNSEKGDPVYADVWVLVDGRVRFKRWQVNAFNGVMRIDISLGGRDHFLTLATTDSGNGSRCDLIMFGDPVLEMVFCEPP